MWRSHPFLDDRQRHCRGDGNDPESMTQAPGGGGGCVNAGGSHHCAHSSPGGRARPRPQCWTKAEAGVVQLQACKRFEQSGRHGDSPKDTSAFLLERFENDDARCRIDPVGHEGERLREAAARVGEDFAERSIWRWGGPGGLQKAVPLVLGQVFALSARVVELHVLAYNTLAG